MITNTNEEEHVSFNPALVPSVLSLENRQPLPTQQTRTIHNTEVMDHDNLASGNNREEKQNNDAGLGLVNHFESAPHETNNKIDKDSACRTRAAPNRFIGRLRRKNLNPSLSLLTKTFEKYICKISIKLKRKFRNQDAIRAFFCRSIRKIPIVIFSMYIKESQAKRKNIETIFKECRRSFNDGFMPLLNKYLRFIDEEHDDIFIDYMCFVFSPSKVIQIFSEIYCEPIDEEYYKIAYRRSIDRKQLKNDKAFCLICRAIEQVLYRKDITVGNHFCRILTKVTL